MQALFVCIIVFRLCVWFDVQPVAQKRHYWMKQKQYHRQSGPLGVHSELGPVCLPYQNKANLFLFASSNVPRLTLTSSTSTPRLFRKGKKRGKRRAIRIQSLGEGERGYILRISGGSHLVRSCHAIIIIVQRTWRDAEAMMSFYLRAQTLSSALHRPAVPPHPPAWAALSGRVGQMTSFDQGCLRRSEETGR